MKRSRFSEEQVIGILREAQAGSSVKTVCAAHNISEATYHAWKRKYGGMDVSEARRLRSLEEENGRLKRIIADLSVQNHILKEVNAKNGEPVCKTAGCEDQSRRGLGQSSAGVPSAGIGAFELLSGRAGEHGKPSRSQGGAGT